MSAPAPSTVRGANARILIGFAEALSAPEVTWSLVDHGFEVIAFARKGRHAALRHSHFVRVHEVTPPDLSVDATLKDLQSLIGSLTAAEPKKPLAFLPLDDAALWLSGRLPEIPGLVIAAPRRSSAHLALDKALQIETARAAGLKVLETTVASTAAEVAAQSHRLPLILKAAGAVVEQKGRLIKTANWICGTKAELEKATAAWAERTPLLVQNFIQGTGEGIFGMALPDGVKAWSGHRRLRMMNPHGSGSSAAMSQTVPPELKEPVQRFLDSVSWRGLFMIELLADDAGQRWFMEFNGRPWGSTALSRRQGLEYPAWNVEMALNASVPIAETPAFSRPVVCRNLGRELMYPLFVLRGPKSSALKQWPSFWKALCEILRIGRGEHFYNWRANDLAVFIGDAYYTVRDQLVKSRA